MSELKAVEYITTREECAKTIKGVCEGCGGKLEPIETEDNSHRPTFWVGCEHCSSFRGGVEERIFKIARQLVESGEMKPYGHMREGDYTDTPGRHEYYLDTQTAAMSRQVQRIEYLLLASRPVREEVGEEMMDLRAEIVTVNAMLAKVESENERLRQIVIDTDKLFTMIDEYLSDLPPVLPEEKKILSLVNKLMGERMAQKAVESALTSRPDTAERLREAAREVIEAEKRYWKETGVLPIRAARKELSRAIAELKLSLLPPTKDTTNTGGKGSETHQRSDPSEGL